MALHPYICSFVYSYFMQWCFIDFSGYIVSDVRLAVDFELGSDHEVF